MYYHPAPTKTQTPNKDEVFLFLLSLQYLTKTTLENFINLTRAKPPLGWADIQISTPGRNIFNIYYIARQLHFYLWSPLSGPGILRPAMTGNQIKFKLEILLFLSDQILISELSNDNVI